MKNAIAAVAFGWMILAAQSGEVVHERFDGGSLNDTVWNRNWGVDLAVLDAAAGNVRFTRTTGFSHLGNNSEFTPPLFTSTVGYARFTIGSVKGTVNFNIGGAGIFADNKFAVVKLSVTSNGTYELFWNNNSAGESLAFDNGNGWTGTVAPGSLIYRVDGGENQFGGAGKKGWGISLADDAKADSFGFWANEPCSYTIDDVIIHDSLTLAQ